MHIEEKRNVMRQKRMATHNIENTAKTNMVNLNENIP